MRLIDADWAERKANEIIDGYAWAIRMAVGNAPTVDAIPIDGLAVWLSGYHVSPPEYALKETGALDPIDQASTAFSPNQIATAWAYHLRKLCESGLVE